MNKSKSVNGVISSKFLYSAVRRINALKKKPSPRQQFHIDGVLIVVGVRAELLPKARILAESLSDKERKRVIYFLNQFLRSEGVNVEVS